MSETNTRGNAETLAKPTDLVVSVLSPLRTVMSSVHGTKVLLTGSEGQIEILPGHVNMIGNLETGIFRHYHSDGKVTAGVISSGFFEVHANRISIIAETLELEHEINLERAKAAEARAREKLKAGKLDGDHFKKYQLKLQRALIRQQLASRTTH